MRFGLGPFGRLDHPRTLPQTTSSRATTSALTWSLRPGKFREFQRLTVPYSRVLELDRENNQVKGIDDDSVSDEVMGVET